MTLGIDMRWEMDATIHNYPWDGWKIPCAHPVCTSKYGNGLLQYNTVILSLSLSRSKEWIFINE
jgi:hypothetical protein